MVPCRSHFDQHSRKKKRGLGLRPAWFERAVTMAVPDFMPAQTGGHFPRQARLLRHADFERVYKQGRRHFSVTMTIFYLPRTFTENEQGSEAALLTGSRIGFTVSRALGGAVQRNRMKRRLREAVRMTRPADGVSVDVVINPKKTILAVDFKNVVSEVKRALEVIEQKLAAPKPAAKSLDAKFVDKKSPA